MQVKQSHCITVARAPKGIRSPVPPSRAFFSMMTSFVNPHFLKDPTTSNKHFQCGSMPSTCESFE